MLRALSTHVFLRQRLHPGLLDTLARGGAQAIEVFAAKQHFDYTSRQHIKEIADWFQSSDVKPHSLHGPLYADSEMGRGGLPSINVVHHEKSRRIDGMDEVKRALEAAEILPYQFLILHLGDRDSDWDERTLEYAITAIEHLKAFGAPLGVKLLLENIQNEATTPANLAEVIRAGHFANVGVCFDIGHANLMQGVDPSLETLLPLIGSTHLHDNNGDRDAHLWPGDGKISWEPAMDALKSAPRSPAALLEIHYELGETPDTIAMRAAQTFEKFGI
ncbi:MAG TPA: sugar phosphate isomerase/epimerase family protein [Acidobacteriaceae bacterium]